MAGKKHTHKYYRATINGFTKVWACALPNCSHHMPKHLEGLINGKASLCWECDQVMAMGPLQLEKEKPICDECNGTANLGDLSPALQALLKQKGVM